MKRLLIALGCLTVPVSLFPLPGLSAQKRAITIDDYLVLKSVGNPQLSPDGKWVAYTVTEQSLNDNRGITRIWLADGASGAACRAGKRQHLFTVTLADGSTRDVTPVDHDVPTIATSGDGDVSVSPDGKEIAVAMHGDSTVADNTNVDVYVMGPDGSGMRALTMGRGADNTPRYSPDGKWLAYLSMERAGFEADRQRLMLVGRSDGRTGGPSVEATKGWTLSERPTSI